MFELLEYILQMNYRYTFSSGLRLSRSSRLSLGRPAFFKRKKISGNDLRKMHTRLAIGWVIILAIIIAVVMTVSLLKSV